MKPATRPYGHPYPVSHWERCLKPLDFVQGAVSDCLQSCSLELVERSHQMVNGTGGAAAKITNPWNAKLRSQEDQRALRRQFFQSGHSPAMVYCALLLQSDI